MCKRQPGDVLDKKEVGMRCIRVKEIKFFEFGKKALTFLYKHVLDILSFNNETSALEKNTIKSRT